MTMNTPLVSAVIPCYNHGKYLQESVNSALNQSHRNVEVIVVDDGSTEKETLEILKKLQDTVTVLRKENGHLSSARNYGIERAKGDFVLILDSDDYFDSKFVELALERIQKNHRVAMVTSWVQYFGDADHVAKTKAGTLQDFLVTNTFCGNFLLRKEAWVQTGGYNEQMKKGLEDWDFTISILSKGYELEVIEQPLFFYRKEGESMSTESEKNRAEVFMQIVKNHEPVYLDNFTEVLKGKEQEITRLRLLNKRFIERIEKDKVQIEDLKKSYNFRVKTLKNKLFNRFKRNGKG